MNALTSTVGALRDRTLFLSASIPQEGRAAKFLRSQGTRHAVREAVVALTRTVLRERGTLVFGGHPTIAPLVALVSGEYLGQQGPTTTGGQQPTGNQVIIFQSSAYAGYLPDETWLLHRLGFAQLRWVPAEGGEKYDPATTDRPQCPKSLASMRHVLLTTTDPDAMVCIGGMEGVIDEADLFSEYCRDRPIYALATTGGAAALLSQRPGGKAIRPIDRLLQDDLAARSGERDARTQVAYAIVMQMIVEELGNRQRS